MYERKNTHRDDIIRRFGSPRRRRSRHGKSRKDAAEPQEVEIVTPPVVAKSSLKATFVMVLVGATALALLYFL